MFRHNKKRGGYASAGFSLPETLVAMLLFAVSLAGLLQYHQVLQQSLLHQMQQRQAWRLAHQKLEGEKRRAGFIVAARSRRMGCEPYRTSLSTVLPLRNGNGGHALSLSGGAQSLVL
ncbi:hypothetical protein OS31_14120 [Dickeya oryzae]